MLLQANPYFLRPQLTLLPMVFAMSFEPRRSYYSNSADFFLPLMPMQPRHRHYHEPFSYHSPMSEAREYRAEQSRYEGSRSYGGSSFGSMVVAVFQALLFPPMVISRYQSPLPVSLF